MVELRVIGNSVEVDSLKLSPLVESIVYDLPLVKYKSTSGVFMSV